MAQYKTYATLVPDKEQDYPHVQNINSLEDRNAIIKNNGVVVIYYHAEWCGPCKNFTNSFNGLAQELGKPGQLVFVKEDVDLDLRNTPEDPKVVPTFHFYKNGDFQKDKILTGVNIDSIRNNVSQLL